MHFASRLGLDQQPCRAPVRDPRIAALEAEIAALRARVAELELALKVALSASATVSSASAASATPARKNKTAPNIIAAKLTVADEPWTALGISRRTYYRRKKASSNA